MTPTPIRWWHRSRDFIPWFVLEALMPGAALFALLLWLSRRFVLEGFREVRQHAFVQVALTWSMAAPAQRSWWSCTCDSASGCRCLAGVGGTLRRCCVKLLNFTGPLQQPAG